MPGPEVHDKSTEIDGLTIQQLLLEDVGYHRYHHDVPNFLSRHAAYGNVT